jgi:hypothetical protein
MLNVGERSASLAGSNALGLQLPGVSTASLLLPVTRMLLVLLMPLLSRINDILSAMLSTVASFKTYAVLAENGRDQSRLAKGIVETASQSEYQCQ